jgi:hypothetical protein
MMTSIFFLDSLAMAGIGLHRHRHRLADWYYMPERSAAALTEAKNEQPQDEYPVASA